jgi:pSer/pThr/pTyr-binding forkhead associated (FHA) protein
MQTTRLTCCGGPHDGDIFTAPHTSQEIIIGRGLASRSQEILFENDDEVSCRHCVISFRNKWTVRDLNSSNGTYVNGKRLASGKQRNIRGFDKVQLGNSVITYVSKGKNKQLVIHTSKSPAIVIDLNPGLQDTYVIGRIPQQSTTMVNLDLDDEISAEHCMLFAKDGNPTIFYIKDLHSTNGTRVNGRMLSESTESQRLHPGDMIAVGQSYMNFMPPFSPSRRVEFHRTAAAATALATSRRQHRSSSVGHRKCRKSHDESSSKRATPDEKKQDGGEVLIAESLFSPANHRQFTRSKKQHVMKTVSRKQGAWIHTPTMRTKDRLLSQLVELVEGDQQRQRDKELLLAPSPSNRIDHTGHTDHTRVISLSFDEVEDNDNNDDFMYSVVREDPEMMKHNPQYRVKVVSLSMKKTHKPSFVLVLLAFLLTTLIAMLSILVYTRIARNKQNVLSSFDSDSDSDSDSTVRSMSLAKIQRVEQHISALENEMQLLSVHINKRRALEVALEITEKANLEKIIDSIAKNIVRKVLRRMDKPLENEHPEKSAEIVKNWVDSKMWVSIHNGGIPFSNFAKSIKNKITCGSSMMNEGGKSPFDSCGLNVHRLLSDGSDWDQCFQFSGKHSLIIQLSSCINIAKVTGRAWSGEQVGKRYRRFPYDISSASSNYQLSAPAMTSADTFTYNIHAPSNIGCSDTLTLDLTACDSSAANDCIAVLCNLMVH